MLTFFRRIRLRLMNQASSDTVRKGSLDMGAVRTYLLYAIGEILLVMIGILLALQVNSWNERQIQLRKERNIVEKILIDLRTDSTLIVSGLEELIWHEELHYQLYAESQDIQMYSDTLNISHLRWNTVFMPVTQNNHKEILQDISNDLLRSKINQYFQDESAVSRELTVFDQYMVETVRPFLAKNGIHISKTLYDHPWNATWLSKDHITLNHKKLSGLYGTVEFDQILFTLHTYTSGLRWYFENLKDVNAEMIKHSKNYLKL